MPKPIPPAMESARRNDWTHVRDVLASREPRTDQKQIIRDVHQLCRDWDAGEMPLVEIRRLTTGQERNIAMRFTPPQHVMFRPMMRMFDDLIDTSESPDEGYSYRTRHGIFTSHDLTVHRGVIERAGTTLLVLFPIRWPWRRKPDKDHGDPGERGDPIYARTAEERWAIANDDTTGAARPRRVFE